MTDAGEQCTHWVDVHMPCKWEAAAICNPDQTSCYRDAASDRGSDTTHTMVTMSTSLEHIKTIEYGDSHTNAAAARIASMLLALVA